MVSGVERRAPFCNTCQLDLTVQHILVDCNVFNAERQRNSLDGKTIQEILGDEADVVCIAKFLKEINLYYEI